MSSYEWKKNCAIVDRCWYFQYTVWITTTVFGGLAFKDLLYIRKNHFADLARKRLPKVSFKHYILKITFFNNYH